ncbi:helix-turn-helix and ligand-binding sensor domain-containing protein [Neolewinella aurantiaca]|uniref:helix-turn-helix and ligand-binding sensor domain-containing protein n=1 Tax=Neolewinella aurantiaca TaxID=2602767 RepID=UPI0016506F4A|nr:LuxR C-terminal-related transcriptional regulator [Neolewinella aurantiaca]
MPPIASFTPETYGGGSQNWAVSQDEQKLVYVANNQGLLEFNGHQWSLYPSPNETIFRSVKAHGERIYTGFYMDFGYWERTPDGKLDYHTLCADLRDRILPDEHFWNIFFHEGYLVFQSLDQLFFHEPGNEEIRIVSPEEGVAKVFPVDGELYFTDQKQRLFRLESGEISPVLSQDETPGYIVHLWKDRDELILQTAAEGCFSLSNGVLKASERNTFLSGNRIYSATDLRRGGRAFGTVSNGVYIVAPDGDLLYHLDQIDGLANNTILSLFEDAQNNLWVATDNGLSCINLSSPLRKFTDDSGQLGTVHASAVFGDDLYLASNQGLFIKSRYGQDLPEIIPGTRGQVWSLFEYNQQLFCAHDQGVFLVNGSDAIPIFSGGGGTWRIETIPGHPDLLLLGNYFGLAVLELKDGNWSFRNKIEGFDYSARFLASTEAGEVYISHEYRGIYGLKVSEDYRTVTEVKLFDTPQKGKNAGLTRFQDSILYFSRDGIFSLVGYEEGFRKSEALSGAIGSTEYSSGKMTVLGDRLWFFTNESISFFHPGVVSDELQRQTIPLPARLVNAKSGYENISESGRDTLLIGTADGYLLLALSAVPLHQHEIRLASATAYPAAGDPIAMSLAENGEVRYEDHSLKFELAVPSYEKYFVPRFQYRLLGLSNEWSEWSPESTLSFPGLQYGKYTLEARSLLGRRSSENTVSYTFRILRPWYASAWAFVVYFLAVGALIYLLHKAYTRYYRNKQRALQLENDRRLAARERETELEMIRINNQRLQEDINSKNREVANSTMSLVRKNELLQQIKENLLSNQNPEKSIAQVIQTIDKNLDEGETWSLFKEAFENADQDFFKKVKELHPELSPNDLKLCAYLRLNLSSKEIAPMLNISPRSVEVKRYRLRKKINLEPKAGLVEYIMSL